MIQGYTKPQLLIQQILQKIQNIEAPSLNALIIGPRFDLFRYTNATERAAMRGVAFVENVNPDPATRQLVPYEGLLPNLHLPDTSFARLYGENLEGQAWAAASSVDDTSTGLYDFKIQSLQAPNKMRVVRRGARVTANYAAYSGQISSVTVVFGGSGYAPNASFDQPVIGGTGSGAVVRLFTDANGAVKQLNSAVISSGSGYTASITFDAMSANVGANVGIVNRIMGGVKGDDVNGDGTIEYPLIQELRGRPIKPGDIFYATYNGQTMRRTVRALERELVPAHYGTDAVKANKTFAASTLNPIQGASATVTNTATPANWSIQLAASQLLGVNVTSGGSGYTSEPDVVISAPIAIGGALPWPAVAATANAVVNSANQVTSVNVTNFGAGYYKGAVVGYLIKTRGTGYDANNPPKIVLSAPSVTDGSGVQAVIEPVIGTYSVGGVAYTGIVDIKVVNPGAGYDTRTAASRHMGNVAPYTTGLTLVGGAGSGAQIIAIVNTGGVRSATVTRMGSNYTDQPAVTFNGAHDGFNVASAVSYLGVVAVAVAAGGSGYHLGQVLNIAAGSALYDDTAQLVVTQVDGSGSILAVGIYKTTDGTIKRGSYVEASLPTTAAAVLETGSATFNLTWGVSKIVITGPGEGYMPATTSIVIAAHHNGGTDYALGTVEVAAAVTVAISGGGGGAAASAVLQSEPGDWSGLVEGSIYNGKYAERYTLTVTKAGVGEEEARVKVRSQSGAFSANNAIAYHYGLGYLINDPALGGLAVELRFPDAAQPLRLGDQFSFVIYGKYIPLELSQTGQVIAVNVLSPGLYTGTAPATATFSAPTAGGTQATGTVQTTGTTPDITVTGITIINPGAGYLSPPAIAIDGEVTSGNNPAVFEVVVTAPETSRDLTVVQSGLYVGTAPTRYKMEVTQGAVVGNTANSFGGAQVRVSDTSGVDTVQNYTVAHDVQYALGTYGLKFLFPKDVISPSGVSSAPTQATATLHMRLDSVPAIGNAGTGHAVGDIITLTTGGTSGTGTAIQVRVTTISGGGGTGPITGIVLAYAGNYSALPSLTTLTQASTTGAGISSTFVIGAGPGVHWAASSVVVGNAGTGYVTTPAAIATGAGGSGIVLGAAVVNGAVYSIAVVSPGSGYTALPTVTIDPPILYQKGLRTGDVYYLDVVPAEQAGAASVVVLNGQATDISAWSEEDIASDQNKFDIDVRVPYTGIIDPKRNTAPVVAWVAGDATTGGILVKDSLAIVASDRDTGYTWLPVKTSAYARLFAHWRGLVPTNSSSRIRLYQSEDAIQTAFGAFDTDNPACYGGIIAFRGAQQKPVYVASLATNDLAGYQAVFRQAERMEGPYSLSAMTFDLDVQKALRDHVDKVSAADWKLWRRAYCATQNPGPYAVMSTDANGDSYNAVINTTAQGNVRVICTNGDFLARGIRAGDILHINFSYDEWETPVFESYPVQTVLENDELILATGPTAPINPAVKFEIWRPDSGLSQAEYVGNRSTVFQDRRVINIWCDTPILTDSDNVASIQANYYLAAEIAGLRSAVLPQQGLTYTELQHALTQAPLMYTKYSTEELNVAAANGTLIVTQDMEDGPVYIRHQLTTDSADTDGPFYWEDSAGTNLDNIAYALKTIYQPYVGKRNANPETCEEMETKQRSMLDDFKNNPGGFSQIGPAVIAYSGVSVTIDPIFRDRVNSTALLELPLPINTVNAVLKATTISDQTLISITLAKKAAQTA